MTSGNSACPFGGGGGAEAAAAGKFITFLNQGLAEGRKGLPLATLFCFVWGIRGTSAAA